MKKIQLILIAFLCQLIYSQDITGKTGAIEVKTIAHRYKLNRDLEPTRRKTNKRGLPDNIFYLDSTGLPLKKIQFGKHHNPSLELLDRVTVYNYTDTLLTGSVTYESDYQKNIYPYWKDTFSYNERRELIADSTFYYGKDSLFMAVSYDYDERSNKIKTNFSPGYYMQRTFDTLNRLTSLRQIYKDSLSWEWKYNYTANRRMGSFQTFYDKNNYTKSEVVTYDTLGNIIELEEKYTSRMNSGHKYMYTYNAAGVLEIVDYYELYSDDGYKKVSETHIKVIANRTLSPRALKKLNKLLIDEDVRQ